MPHDGLVEIKEGVRAGDWVVVSGMQRLKNGKVVQAEKYSQSSPAANVTQKSAAKTTPTAKAASKTAQPASPFGPQETYVTYDLPIEETVQTRANRGRVRSDLLG